MQTQTKNIKNELDLKNEFAEGIIKVISYSDKHHVYWWLVRVTLVVDWLFLPQNFWPVVGTYEGLLRLCEWTLGGDYTSRWWGHISTTCHHRSVFLPMVVGALKPSITFVSLPLLPLAPLLLPLTPLAPFRSPRSLSPLAPTEVVGTPKHCITYPYPTLAIGSERKREGSEREQAERDPWPNRAGGHRKNWPHRW